ncbi:uncharacterized protein [Oscarella lobularis]|uniref:uncharacterized protein isoform X1 n=1 Tax=Oscarella lobularis TaxID=121494 RepID=UPI0033136005
MPTAALLIFTAFLATCGFVCASGPQLSVVDVKSYTKVQSHGNSTLYEIVANATTSYAIAPYLVELVGTRYDMGYAYGTFFGDRIEKIYDAFLKSQLGKHWYDDALIDVIGIALDWQWNNYLSIQVPETFKEELDGIRDGASAAGCPGCGSYVTRTIVLANMPGDVQDVLYILIREAFPSALHLLPRKASQEKVTHRQCSMFGIWGSRTENQKLFSARNLDWNKDSGINKLKVITVYKPSDGAYAHATVGFVPLYGALAGMSASGITVHEANLEEDQITFNGFPWVLRLRYIMEKASNLEEARSLWENTNNTVGFNHMVGSGNDAVAYAMNKSKYCAVAMETMFNYTAFFPDNDPREANALYTNSETNSSDHIGFPVTEAVWRTNHGYDPIIREHYEWSQSPTSWSMQRYVMIHEAITSYERNGISVGPMEAINITAIVGDKGHHAYDCMDNTDGTNVLSVTYDPNDKIMYTAWESKAGENWRPACCSSYLKVDMTPWFS